MGLVLHLIVRDQMKGRTVSIQQDAEALIAHSNDFVQNGIAATNTTGDSLRLAMQTLARVQELAADSMAQAHSLLGTGHTGIGAIGATSNSVSQKAEDAIGAIQAAMDSVMAVDQSINTHGNTVSSIGHALLQGRI
jgi:hypothetical protein